MEKPSWKKSLLVICKILGLFVNTLTADDKCYLLNSIILTQPITSRSAWLLLRIWFLSKVGKSLIGKLQEELEFRVSGLKN